jgi:hypothetical protein
MNRVFTWFLLPEVFGCLDDVDFAVSDEEIGALEIFVSILCCGEEFQQFIK